MQSTSRKHPTVQTQSLAASQLVWVSETPQDALLQTPEALPAAEQTQPFLTVHSADEGHEEPDCLVQSTA
jgi:hypothetical protein